MRENHFTDRNPYISPSMTVNPFRKRLKAKFDTERAIDTGRVSRRTHSVRRSSSMAASASRSRRRRRSSSKVMPLITGDWDVFSFMVPIVLGCLRRCHSAEPSTGIVR